MNKRKRHNADQLEDEKQGEAHVAFKVQEVIMLLWCNSVEVGTPVELEPITNCIFT
jgi:hypothetical protein